MKYENYEFTEHELNELCCWLCGCCELRTNDSYICISCKTNNAFISLHHNCSKNCIYNKTKLCIICYLKAQKPRTCKCLILIENEKY